MAVRTGIEGERGDDVRSAGGRLGKVLGLVIELRGILSLTKRCVESFVQWRTHWQWW